MIKTVTFEELEHFKILDDDTVKISTNLNEDSFIVKNSLKQNHHFSKFRKLSKDKYLDIETGEIKEYKQNEYKTEKSLKRSMNKLKELLELNFTDKTNCLFVTLTTANLNGFDDIKTVKEHFKKFKRKLKDKYEDIAYVVKFERNSNGNWHMHLLVKYLDNRPIFIDNNKIEEIWGNNTKTTSVNKQDINKVIDYMAKTTQLYNVPKNVEIFTKSDNLRVKREQMTFKEFKEKIQDNYYKISQKGIIVRHIMTNKILNLHKKMVFRKRINTINKNIKKEKKAQKVITRVLSKTLKAEIIIALVYLVLFNSNIF